MKVRRWGRASGSFSLNEAARIRRMLRVPAGDVTCPRCARPMERVVGGRDRDVWLLCCQWCALSVVLQEPL